MDEDWGCEDTATSKWQDRPYSNTGLRMLNHSIDHKLEFSCRNEEDGISKTLTLYESADKATEFKSQSLEQTCLDEPSSLYYYHNIYKDEL